PAGFDAYVRFPNFALQILLFVIVFQICLYYSDFHDLRTMRSHSEQWLCLGQSLGIGCILLALTYYVFPQLLIGRGVFFISMALLAAFVVISRMALEAAWHVAGPSQNMLVLGTHGLALTVANELARRGDLNIRLAGFVETGTGEADSLFGHPILGNAAELEAIAAAHRISRIVVAMEDRRGALPIRELVRLRVQGVRVEDAHSTIAALSGRVWLETVQPSWFVFSDGFHRSRLTWIAKRLFDLFFGCLGLGRSAPGVALVAILIRLDSPGPIIYRQRRVGLRGETFEVLKFRSMRTDAEKGGAAQWAQQNDPRVTRIGKYLRKYRFDELPQFLNVIRGDMSFVGPRPERPVFVEQLRKEISYYDERHSVRPGLTGWAQVQYQYGSSIEDAFRKLEYDLFYLKNMSVFFDFAIILQTIRIVISGHGGR